MRTSETDENSTDTLRAAVRGFATIGLAPERELARLGVRLDGGAVKGPVPRALYCAFWDRMARAAGREDLGLEIARRTEPGSLGTLEWLAWSARTVGDALGALARHGRLLHSGGEYTLQLHAREARFTYHGGLRVVPNRPTLDWSFSQLVRGIARAVPTEGRVRRVHLQYARPADAARVEERFEAEVVYGGTLNQIVLPREVLDHALPTRDDEAHAALDAICRARAPQPSLGLLSRVEAHVLACLQQGEVPSLEEVARAVGTSVRSLQRALGAADDSFRELLLRARMELARRWLAQPGASVADVAHRLGYSEAGALLRAYRATFGAAPGEAPTLRVVTGDRPSEPGPGAPPARSGPFGRVARAS